LCARCERAAALQRGELPPQRGAAVPDEERAAFSASQLAPAVRPHVDVWLVPRRRWCPLWLARVVLWCRWACVAGVLEGPPDSCLRQGGRGTGRARYLGPPQLAAHLRDLRGRGGWPDGAAPVLLTGVSDVASVHAALALLDFPAAERDRLAACPASLSELQTGPALRRADFVADPRSQSSHILVLRCTLAMERAGLAPGGTLLPRFTNTATLDQPGSRGDAFRQLQLWT